MEAATFQKKKSAHVSKGKVKRTIKNVLCRPDPVFWPKVSEQQAKLLQDTIAKYKVEIPEFKKQHWKELKNIPKDQRPKQPKITRVEGLIHGLRECIRSLESKECSAVIIESSINPQTIVQPLIEACISAKVPVVCMENLKKISSNFFGIPTTCLGIRIGCLEILTNEVNDVAKLYTPPPPIPRKKNKFTNEIIELDEKIENPLNVPISYTYLYRTNKKARVFNPSETKTRKAFTGQDYIEFSEKHKEKTNESKAYMSMILKRIGNNQNRVKRK